MRKYDLDIKSSDLRQELLNDMDAVLIITDHTNYDYEWIVKNAKIVIDTRNATHNVSSNRHKIIKA